MSEDRKLYCIDCKEETPHTPKLSAVMSGFLVCENCYRMNPFCLLTKTDDDRFNKTSFDFRWVEFDQQKLTAIALHETPKIGYSLLMSPFNMTFTWQTTPITEIIEDKDGYIHFKTKNSEYVLRYNKNVINEFLIK